MGYSHYVRRFPELDPKGFSSVGEDAQKIINALDAQGIPLAGPLGTGKPVITDSVIAFNGVKECGHGFKDLGHPWPSQSASGFTPVPKVAGRWFGGALIDSRACGGSCSGGPFILDRVFLVREWDQLQGGRYFDYCETAYRPYDIAVTAFLVRAKVRLGTQVLVASDGELRDWDDARRLSRELFGWADFALDHDEDH